ncbi:hypothetical protein, partial [Acinetobacter baumannii]|uniref:hypothetical protein n=1 Tax=Acinetobacter baumannii TaxID=470 RepID=UPI00358E8564
TTYPSYALNLAQLGGFVFQIFVQQSLRDVVMAKRFSPEFKQQTIDYALSNSHESVAAIAPKLEVGWLFNIR